MSQSEIEIKRRIPVRHEVEVFIAGGGPSGCAAAIAAARQGASVFLAEGEICLGGTGTSGGIPMLVTFTDGVNFLSAGVGREIHDRLIAAGGTFDHPLRKQGDLYFQPEVLKSVYDELITAEPRITCSLATQIIGIESEGGKVSHVICNAKSGMFAVRVGAVVDATGDGDICVWAGAPFTKGDDLGRTQAGTMVSMWAGIDWPTAEAAGFGVWNQSSRIKDAIADGAFTCPDPVMPGIIPTGHSIGNGNVGHLFGVDGTDERSLTAAAMLARRQMREYGNYFRKYLKGYEKMELSGSASMVGIRETRRITGDYELSVEDFKNRSTFDDEIGRFAYPVDLHPVNLEDIESCNKKFEKLRLAPGESYGVPFRILTPRKLKNVLVAGRCVSTDRGANGSLRVMPGCYITGQAAGVGATIAASSGTDVHALPIGDIQRRLRALGQWLPNAA